MNSKHPVLIAEDHQLFRDGLKSILEGRGDIEIVGEAEDGLEAIHKIRKTKPELVLLDLSMPKMNGISVTKEVKRESPQIKIMILSIHEAKPFVVEAFNAGADGYCLKDASRRELMFAVESVLEGKPYISPGITGRVGANRLRHLQRPGGAPRLNSEPLTRSKRGPSEK